MLTIQTGISGPTRWELTLQLPLWSLRFAIPTSGIVATFHDFLAHDTSGGTLPLGTIGDSNVSIIRDDEFTDRFFITFTASDGAMHYALDTEHRTDLISALRQAGFYAGAFGSPSLFGSGHWYNLLQLRVNRFVHGDVKTFRMPHIHVWHSSRLDGRFISVRRTAARYLTSGDGPLPFVAASTRFGVGIQQAGRRALLLTVGPGCLR